MRRKIRPRRVATAWVEGAARDLSRSRVRAEARIISPPVEPDLLGLVDRADEQPHLDGEELDVGEVDLDVAGHDEALVEHPIEDVDEAMRARRRYKVWQGFSGFELLQLAQRTEVD